MFRPAALLIIAILGTLSSGGAVGTAGAQPSIPATFFGSATIDGGRVPEGTVVRAFIGGVDCTQAGAAGTSDDGRTSVYAILVVADGQQPGCGRDGARVTFTIDGLPARQTATWRAAVQQVELDAVSGRPTPGATATAQRASTPSRPSSSATPGTPPVPPTDDITPPPIGGIGRTARASATPSASGGGGRGGGGGSVVMVVGVSLAVMAVVAGGLGIALARRRNR